MRFLFRAAAWFALVYFTWLITRNSLVYFNEPRAHGFVWEKGELAENPVWLAALVVHVGAGIVCLASSFLQFFRPLLKRAPWLHRWLGRAYVGSILVVLAPTGFYLAFYAHGGVAGTVGFLILGVLTTGSTWRGWRAIRAGRTREHTVWMIRSLAMVTTAITFRIEHIAMQLLGVDPVTGFLAALYLSIAGNAFAAEFVVHKIQNSKRKHRTNTEPIPENENHHPVPLSARHS